MGHNHLRGPIYKSILSAMSVTALCLSACSRSGPSNPAAAPGDVVATQLDATLTSQIQAKPAADSLEASTTASALNRTAANLRLATTEVPDILLVLEENSAYTTAQEAKLSDNGRVVLAAIRKNCTLQRPSVPSLFNGDLLNGVQGEVASGKTLDADIQGSVSGPACSVGMTQKDKQHYKITYVEKGNKEVVVHSRFSKEIDRSTGIIDPKLQQSSSESADTFKGAMTGKTKIKVHDGTIAFTQRESLFTGDRVITLANGSVINIHIVVQSLHTPEDKVQILYQVSTKDAAFKIGLVKTPGTVSAFMNGQPIDKETIEKQFGSKVFNTSML